jgi:hypothetical protein
MKTYLDRALCIECKKNRAGYIYRGKWRRDAEHLLCSRCFKSAVDKVQAEQEANQVMNKTRPH